MRVLLPVIWHELTYCIGRAFEDAGHEIRVVDWRKYSKEQHRHRIEPYCIEEARAFLPDLAFCQFQAPGLITPKFPKELKDLGCFSVNWTGDVRHPLPDWYKEVAPYFSVSAFTNLTDVEEVRALGHRSEFLQIGYDARIYNTEGAGVRSGIVFLGNNYGGYKYAESQSRRDMVHAMKEAFGDDFKVYGMSWEPYRGQYVREPEDAPILRQSLIALNWDHFHRPGFASDRLLRATACGCYTISQYYEGIDEEHPDVVAVRSIPEMVDAVKVALSNPERTQALGAKMAAHTPTAHQWGNRVKIIEGWMR